VARRTREFVQNVSALVGEKILRKPVMVYGYSEPLFRKEKTKNRNLAGASRPDSTEGRKTAKEGEEAMQKVGENKARRGVVLGAPKGHLIDQGREHDTRTQATSAQKKKPHHVGKKRACQLPLERTDYLSCWLGCGGAGSLASEKKCLRFGFSSHAIRSAIYGEKGIRNQEAFRPGQKPEKAIPPRVDHFNLAGEKNMKEFACWSGKGNKGENERGEKTWSFSQGRRMPPYRSARNEKLRRADNRGRKKARKEKKVVKKESNTDRR